MTKFENGQNVHDGNGVYRIIEVLENHGGFGKHAYQVIRRPDGNPFRIREEYLQPWPDEPGKFSITPDPEM